MSPRVVRPSPFTQAIRRGAAFAVDGWLIAAWGALLFAVTMQLTGGEPPAVRNPWVGQAVGFFTMTSPVILYFALTESSRWQASVGKRRLGLHLTTQNGDRLTFKHSLFRNTVKLLPWEAGHLVAWQAVSSSHAGLPTWLSGFMIVSTAVPLWWLVVLLATGATPYDRWLGVDVTRLAGRPGTVR